MTGERRIHDMGGQPAGPIDTSHHEEADWHKMVTALGAALGPAGTQVTCVHERRRTTEDLGEAYNHLGYFDKSTMSTARLMMEKGLLTEDEIADRMAEIKARREGKG